MTNEQFQIIVLEKLDSIENRLDTVETELEMVKTRQEETYQIVKAIHHSNEVGRAKLDEHEYRIVKNEGKFKKIKNVLDEVDQASSL